MTLPKMLDQLTSLPNYQVSQLGYVFHNLRRLDLTSGLCKHCAKSLQSCLTLCDPMDYSLPVSSVHEILQAKILGVDSHFLLQEFVWTQGSNPCLLCLLHFQMGSLPLLLPRKWTLKVKFAQLCLTLWDPMECSQPGPSAHGIVQARTLEWVAVPIPRGSSQSREQTQVFCTAGRSLPSELPGKPQTLYRPRYQIDWEQK